MIQAKFPSKLRPIFQDWRYIVFHGGRGSAKSWSVAKALLIQGAQKKKRILCTREIQKSIKDSVHKLLVDKIAELQLGSFYEVTQTSITGKNGTEFLFAGLRANVEQIKSMEGIDDVWVEEAEKVSENSWAILIPTIRKAGSRIIITFNPDLETDPTSKRFLLSPPPNACVTEVNWRDNPWFPPTLAAEMAYDFKVDPDNAQHVWEGKFRKRTKASIFAGKWTVDAFEPGGDWNGPYFGADFGFAQDPATLMKLWIFDNKLWVEHEAYGVGIELDDLAKAYDTVPGSRQHVIRADNSRPETISFMAQRGFKITAAKKWPGSVEDGISFLKNFEQIVIHPRCAHQAAEARAYSFKVDKLTGDVLPVIVDAHNHCWDADRYALEPLISHEVEGVVEYSSPVQISPDLDELDYQVSSW
jgi:phage terminase large subunit